MVRVMADSNSNRPALASDCCQPTVPDPRIRGYFDRKVHGLATAGHVFGLGPVSRRLLAELADAGDARPSVLELGCGPGSLTLALLERGAARATGIDLSPESVEVARRRAVEAGIGDRAKFMVGDAASVALEPHDWVVLDKVICCYRDLDALLARSIAAAGRRYVFVVPDSRGVSGLLNRIWVRLEDATNGLRGRPCPGYIHDLRVIEARLDEAGFRRVGVATFRLWYLAVFERPG
jgi:magnesium-protoporphyrin O-methyltransferase